MCSLPPDESGAICLVQAIGDWATVGHSGRGVRPQIMPRSPRLLSPTEPVYNHHSVCPVADPIARLTCMDWLVGRDRMHIQSVYDQGPGQVDGSQRRCSPSLPVNNLSLAPIIVPFRELAYSFSDLSVYTADVHEERGPIILN